MQKFVKGDYKFWHQTAPVIAALCAKVGPDANVLEIGPGTEPFPLAKTFVDIRDFGNGLKTINCNGNDTPLPFADKSFDFVYARHVLEDMWNPWLLCREMQRVAKAGYIETPSPLAEFARGVDGASPAWRGYCHHHYFIWPHQSTLYFVSKYPMV